MRMKQRVVIRKGQLWRKRRTHNTDLPPYYVRVISKGKHDKWKTMASDGCTHTFIAFILIKHFDLVE